MKRRTFKTERTGRAPYTKYQKKARRYPFKTGEAYAKARLIGEATDVR